MHEIRNLTCLICAAMLLACSGGSDPESDPSFESGPEAAGFEGVWRAEGTLTLTIDPIVAGEMTARLVDDGGSNLHLAGQSDGQRIRGDATDDGGMELGFTAQLDAGRLALAIHPIDRDGNAIPEATDTLWFSRGIASGPRAPSAATASSTPHTVTPPTGDTESHRPVYINRARVGASLLRAVETKYGAIQDGRYWYDVACGAWGVEGGPAAGFLAAGLNLPSPMPVDISGGGTGIWINGREIHPLDQAALHQIFGTTIPGRYWLDAQGNLGPEGGAAIANLATAIQASRGGGGSVTHGYGSAGGARGTVGGGMYSGRTATGKSVFWYPGM